MKSTLSMNQLEEQSYSVGDEVMYAHNQAADIKGYNRTATVTKVMRFETYEIKDNTGMVVSVGTDDIAPLSSKA